MKIIKVQDVTSFRGKENHNMDLMNVLVEYEDGVTGNSYMYRAKYDRYIYQQKLIEKYNIPECDLNVFRDFILDEIESDHFYDKED